MAEEKTRQKGNIVDEITFLETYLMIDLDLKDRKILYQLDLNSRQSFRSIGRTVGLSKDVVAARVRKLQDQGIIKKFLTYYDILQLGYNMLRFYYTFQYATPQFKKDIIKHFYEYDKVIILFSTEGNFDLGAMMMVDTISDIYPFWRKTLEKYGDYFLNQVFSAYMGELIYGHPFILNEHKKTYLPPLQRNLGRVAIDEVDLNLLKLLVSDARMPTIEIAERLGVNAKTVLSRLKRLQEEKVILGFSIELDLDKIGYQVWKVDFYVSEYTKIHEIVKYIETNPLLFSVDYTIGYADLEIELHARNIKQLTDFIEDLHSKFPKVIRQYTYFRGVKFYKWYDL